MKLTYLFEVNEFSGLILIVGKVFVQSGSARELEVFGGIRVNQGIGRVGYAAADVALID